MAAPWFKLYPKQYLADSKVKMLSREHRSILVELWCYCSEDGSIPADAGDLSRLLGESVATTKKAMEKLASFFVHEGDRLVSVRLKSEAEAYEAKCQKLRESASIGGLQKVANARANASDEPKQMLLQNPAEDRREKKEKDIPPTPLPSAAGDRKREPRPKVLGDWPPELDQAVAAWRDLNRALRSDEVLARFKPEQAQFIAQVGTKGKTWEAWRKRVGTFASGVRVTDAHILGAVELWANRQHRLATEGKSLSAKSLPALINNPDFDDALIHVAAQEVPHAS